MSGAATGRTFTFIRLIASGGFGSVYLAKMVQSDGFSRICAVKLLHPRWSEDAEAASRMRDEARLLGWLRHRNIVEVFDLTRVDGRIALVMEYLDAIDTKAMSTAARESGRPIPIRAVLELGALVAAALDAAYNRPPYAGERPLRVVHRDIKPSNIMVDAGGGVKVLDFGVARAEFDERESHTQEVTYGSLEYMPPERLFYEPDSDRSDVYSLGATLFELLALERFGKARLRAEQHADLLQERLAVLWRERAGDVAPDVQREIDGLLRSMLAYDDGSRPSAASVGAALRGLARRCTDLGLEEWAERVIPQILRMAHDQQESGADHLCDRTFPEESRGFRAPGDVSVPMPIGGPPTPDPVDADLDRSDALANARWAAQRDALVAGTEPPPPVAAAIASPAPAEPRSARRWWILGGVVAVGLLALSALTAAVGLAVGAPWIAAWLEAPTEAPPPTPVAPPSPDPAPPAAADGPGVTFTSAWDGTVKVTARCTAGEGAGSSLAAVSGEVPGTCTVTAVDASRRRLTAVIKDAEPRPYVCFEGGSKTCG